MIRYHHSPQQASKACFDLVALIYLGDVCYYYSRGEYLFPDISSYVLDYFKISYQAEFDKLTESLSERFNARQKNRPN